MTNPTLRELNCEISGCPHKADRVVTMRHPDPSSRWSAPLCGDCAKEAHELNKGGMGELTYAPIPKEPATSPTLRELVDMLPPWLRFDALQNFDIDWRNGRWEQDGEAINEETVESHVGWHLVRWLGERGVFVGPTVGGRWATICRNYFGVLIPTNALYATPLEAAVRAVVACGDASATTPSPP